MKKNAGKGVKGDALQYSIRGVPAELDRALRHKAAERKQSLNQVILDELTAAALGRQKRIDFSDLVGQWVPDPEFDEMIAAQRRIHPEEWK